MKAIDDFFRQSKGQRGNAVIAFHAPISRVISGTPNSSGRKVLILDLGFLQTHHVRLVLGDPVENDGKPLPDGIDVVGGDFHG